MCSDGPTSTITVTASNTGAVASDVSVLCFACSTNTTHFPARQLVGFGRARDVQPGLSALVRVDVLPRALQLTDSAGAAFAAPSTFELRCGGEPDGFASSTVSVEGGQCSIFGYPH